MKPGQYATVEDLYRTPGKAELVDDRLVVMEPTGGLPGYAASRILESLMEYADRNQSGYAVGDNVGFLVDLPHRKSFCPDVSYYTGRLTMKFLEGAPIFAVEVRSEHDYGSRSEEAMARKRADYFAAGTQVVWDVDLLSDDVVRVYRPTAPEQPTVYRRGQRAEAEPALPDWRFPVDALFPEER